MGEGAEFLRRAPGDRPAVHAYMTEVHAVGLLGTLEDAGFQGAAGGADGVRDGRRR
ncbi:hypothetical protein OH768_16660 [Streptomyces sp. NBC_01622]|uniref:hypothetical protein n=1 Tax=Streptomyces sp. NBC_01622 TaxID=2975903 RepID=UPI003866EE0D|nr:hypothetical protein OH768_16660 [Streptomyces sp. NBC_01622]